MKGKEGLRRVIAVSGNSLINALLAPSCAVCSVQLQHPLTDCVCEICWSCVMRITAPICDGCGDPIMTWPSPLCGRCRARSRLVDRARAVGHYDGTLREIIHAMKYQGRRSLIPRLAAQMQESGAEILKEADYAVPVPLHVTREFSRGFNQAAELAKFLGLPLLAILRRTRHTPSQVDLPAAERYANVQGAFALRRSWFGKVKLAGKRVVIVDDVSTTGATLDACASVLKEAGAAKVFALTAARVVSTRVPSPEARVLATDQTLNVRPHARRDLLLRLRAVDAEPPRPR